MSPIFSRDPLSQTWLDHSLVWVLTSISPFWVFHLFTFILRWKGFFFRPASTILFLTEAARILIHPSIFTSISSLYYYYPSSLRCEISFSSRILAMKLWLSSLSFPESPFFLIYQSSPNLWEFLKEHCFLGGITSFVIVQTWPVSALPSSIWKQRINRFGKVPPEI